MLTAGILPAIADSTYAALPVRGATTAFWGFAMSSAHGQLLQLAV